MKKILCFLSFIYGCSPSETEITNAPKINNYKLIVLVNIEGCKKDTLTCTYTSRKIIEPELVKNNNIFNYNCALYMFGENWHKILANNVNGYRVLSNGIK